MHGYTYSVDICTKNTCMNIYMVPNQLLHDNKHIIIIYSNSTTTHMAILSFFHAIFFLYKFQGA